MDDQLLKNPPLVEVIAELQWALPGGNGQFDPQWFNLQSEMARWGREAGYGHFESLVPAGYTVPLDMLGRIPILRLRKAADSWPVVQVGQGLLTVNAVPPYDGWNVAVAPLLMQALQALYARDPRRSDQALTQVELRYVDAFTAKHGVDDPRQYIADELKLVPNMPSPWLDVAADAMGIAFSGECRFDVRGMEGTQAFIRYGLGEVPTGRAALVNMAVRASMNKPLTVDAIVGWFEQAHEASRRLFAGMLSERVRKEVQ